MEKVYSDRQLCEQILREDLSVDDLEEIRIPEGVEILQTEFWVSIDPVQPGMPLKPENKLYYKINKNRQKQLRPILSFNMYSTLKRVFLPKTLTIIGEDVFGEFASLKKISLPPSIREIRHGAFNNSSVDEIIIPDSCESIGNHVFYESKLTCISIPSTLTEIGDACFEECSDDLIITIRII